MFVQIPEHLVLLPNLCWLSLIGTEFDKINKVGNPCYTPNKEMIHLKGKTPIQTIIVGENVQIQIDSNMLRCTC